MTRGVKNFLWKGKGFANLKRDAGSLERVGMQGHATPGWKPLYGAVMDPICITEASVTLWGRLPTAEMEQVYVLECMGAVDIYTFIFCKYARRYKSTRTGIILEFVNAREGMSTDACVV